VIEFEFFVDQEHREQSLALCPAAVLLLTLAEGSDIVEVQCGDLNAGELWPGRSLLVSGPHVKVRLKGKVGRAGGNCRLLGLGRTPAEVEQGGIAKLF